MSFRTSPLPAVLATMAIITAGTGLSSCSMTVHESYFASCNPHLPTETPTVPVPQSNIGAVVVIKNHTFAPRIAQIKAGQYVEWRFEDGVTQHFLSGFGTYAETRLNCGTEAILFSKPGTFTYHCGIHPDMTATVEVK